MGTRLGGSPGGSRIYRTSYGDAGMVRLARRAVEEWRRLDRSLLLENGLFETGLAAAGCADALQEAGEPFEWLEPGEARSAASPRPGSARRCCGRVRPAAFVQTSPCARWPG